MKGIIIRECKSFREEGEQISWSANNGNLTLTSGKQVVMKGENGGVKFTRKG